MTITKNKKLLAGGLAVVLCVSAVALSPASAADKDAQQQAYKETSVSRGNVTLGVTETGTASLEAIALTYDNYSSTSSDDNSSTVKALVEEVYVKAGQRVQEGDPIAKLSTEEIEEQLSTLQQSYREAQLGLEKAKLDQTSGGISAQATLTTRLNDAANADLNYDLSLEEADGSLGSLKVNMNTAGDRVEELENELADFEEKYDNLSKTRAALNTQLKEAQEAGDAAAVASIQKELAELDTFEQSYRSERQKLYTQLSTAYSTYETAKLKFDIADNSGSVNEATAQSKREQALSYKDNAQELYDLEIAQLANSVSSKELTMENLQKKIDKMQAYVTDGQVKATCDGLIMNVFVVAGDKVSPNETLASIANSENVYISVSIDQTDISTLTLGKEANILFDAYPDQQFTGVVDSITTTPAMSNSSTVSYTVKVKLSGDLDKLYEGMTGSVTFITEEVKDVLKVSTRAVYTENDKSYVKVKDAEGNIIPTEVETGFQSDTETEIVSGLTEGQTVIIESKIGASAKSGSSGTSSSKGSGAASQGGMTLAQSVPEGGMTLAQSVPEGGMTMAQSVPEGGTAPADNTSQGTSTENREVMG